MREDQRAKTKPPARLITTAWGKRFIDELLEVTLPALLASGNLPALTQAFSCELVVVTERSEFRMIENSRVYKHIRKYCAARLIPIDDLLTQRGSYGITLTYAYHRGFADLGERMVDFHLFFFNADFILADGCYRSVIDRLSAGERVILAPSYCVYAEQALPLLRRRIDRTSQVLAVAPRQMAAIALEHRHHTIKGKTVNQRLFHMPWIEQFYWHLDRHTLLAHQLPISIVCLRPSRVYAEPVTFWDYGLLSEICPGVEPCVLADSDDFCMIELRERSTAEEELLLGWPPVEEIARELSTFVTQDQMDHGRCSLVLHSRDLPATFEAARSELRRYVDSVYALVTPKSHFDHKFWQYHYPFLIRLRTTALVRDQILANTADGTGRTTLPSIVPEVTFRSWRDPIVELPKSRLRRTYERWPGRMPRVGRWHPYFADFEHIVFRLDQVLVSGTQRRLIINSSAGIVSRIVEAVPGNIITVSAALAINHRLRPPDLGRLESPAVLVPSASGIAVGYDLCLCELLFEELIHLRDLLPNISAAMRPGGKILVFHHNVANRKIEPKHLSLIVGALPASETSAITFAGFSGSLTSRLARCIFRAGAALYGRHRRLGQLALVASTAAAAPLAYRANRRAVSQTALAVPTMCTSITIEITLEPDASLSGASDKDIHDRS